MGTLLLTCALNDAGLGEGRCDGKTDAPGSKVAVDMMGGLYMCAVWAVFSGLVVNWVEANEVSSLAKL